jgi:pimeloyl-ACP methyl ester carboxylesterase
VDRVFLERFRRHWAEGYDWRASIDELNRFPQYIAEVDGIDIHLILQEGEGEHRTPLLITHGWPGSQLEFWEVIERLAFPSRFGGKAEDAFDVVVPSMPGYGFSGPPPSIIGPAAVADLWRTLMVDVLGYRSFLAQGGDWGSAVTTHLGLRHGDVVDGIHINTPFLALRPLPPASEEEAEWSAQIAHRHAEFGGYQAIHMRRPSSMAWATAGSPLGAASWILERFHDWTELGGRDLDEAFPLDRLVTNAMLYVMGDRFATSLWMYRGHFEEERTADAAEFCATPTGYAAFAGDPMYPAAPRSRVERSYNLEYLSHPGRGGHFAAFEEPVLFAEDVLEWGRRRRAAGS